MRYNDTSYYWYVYLGIAILFNNLGFTDFARFFYLYFYKKEADIQILNLLKAFKNFSLFLSKKIVAPSYM